MKTIQLKLALIFLLLFPSLTFANDTQFVNIAVNWMKVEQIEYDKVSAVINSKDETSAKITKLNTLKKALVRRRDVVPYQKDKGIKKDIVGLVTDYTIHQMEAINHTVESLKSNDVKELKSAQIRSSKAKQIFQLDLPKKIAELRMKK